MNRDPDQVSFYPQSSRRRTRHSIRRKFTLEHSFRVFLYLRYAAISAFSMQKHTGIGVHARYFLG